MELEENTAEARAQEEAEAADVRNSVHFSALPDYQSTVPLGPHPSLAMFEHPGFLESLSDEHRAAIQELKRNLPLDMDLLERCLWDDRQLRRFLVARDWNVKKSTDLMLESIRWRSEFKPLSIRPEDVHCEFEWRRMYRHGTDLNRRPIVMVIPTGKTSEDWDKQLQYLIFNLESAIASMDASASVEQMAWVLNWSGFSLSDAAPRAFGQRVLNVLSTNYPERLAGFFSLDAPLLFRVVWNFLSPFINSNTKRKMHFLTGSIAPGSNKYRKMADFFDLDQIEIPYCGRNHYDIGTGDNAEVYWKKVMDDFAAREELYRQRLSNFLQSKDGLDYLEKRKNLALPDAG